VHGPVGDGDFATVELIELKLNRHVLREAEVQSAAVHECFDLDGVEVWTSRVGERNSRLNEAHGRWSPSPI
jgi:hypothetical protein